MGDEGFFPTRSNTTLVTDFFASIVHLMYNSGKISLPGQPMRPPGEFALNTGDNVYNTGSEDSYRDFWMPVWNSDVDSDDRGAPFIRTFKNYIVIGNHDIERFLTELLQRRIGGRRRVDAIGVVAQCAT